MFDSLQSIFYSFLLNLLKYVIPFDSIVNAFLFLILLSDCSVQVYGNGIDLYNSFFNATCWTQL